MQVKRWVTWRDRRSRRPVLWTVVPVFALRDTLPIVPAPREKEGSGLPWRPVLFGLGAVVGFAVVLQRARKAPTPAHPATATSSGVADSSVGRSIHLPRPRPLPAPLRDSIEAELRADGPLLFSPPDAIDPIGAEALEADGDDQERGGT